MKVTVNTIKKEPVRKICLEEFADKYGLEMVVSERSNPSSESYKFYARFRSVEVSEGYFLIGTHGDGNTPEAAIKDYGERISNKTIVYKSYTAHREEIVVPEFDMSNYEYDDNDKYVDDLMF